MAEGGKLAWVLLRDVGIRPSVHRLATPRRTVSPRPPRVSTAQAESRVQYSSLIAYGDPSIIYESLEHPHQEGCHRSIWAGVVIFRKVPPPSARQPPPWISQCRFYTSLRGRGSTHSPITQVCRRKLHLKKNKPRWDYPVRVATPVDSLDSPKQTVDSLTSGPCS